MLVHLLCSTAHVTTRSNFGWSITLRWLVPQCAPVWGAAQRARYRRLGAMFHLGVAAKAESSATEDKQNSAEENDSNEDPRLRHAFRIRCAERDAHSRRGAPLRARVKGVADNQFPPRPRHQEKKLRSKNIYIEDKEDRAHYASCRSRVCQRCIFIRVFSKWHSKFRILPQGVKLASLSIRARQVAMLPWLDRKIHVDGSVTVGCVVCSHLQDNGSSAGTAFANYVAPLPKDCKPARFTRHQESHRHQMAAHQYVMSAAPPVSQSSMLAICATATPAAMVPPCAPHSVSLGAPELVVGAPDWHRFSAAWDGCCAGSSYAAMKHVGSKTKIARLQWCLYEALRKRYLEFLKKAQVVWLARDERHGRLLIRFKASMFANGRITACDGVLGQIKNFGTGAEKLADATRQVFRRFVSDGQVTSGLSGATMGRKCNPVSIKQAQLC